MNLCTMATITIFRWLEVVNIYNADAVFLRHFCLDLQLKDEMGCSAAITSIISAFQLSDHLNDSVTTSLMGESL